MTCPTGSSAAALGRMQQQGQEWADRVKSGKLSHRNMWFMMDWHISLLGRIGSMPVESVLTARPQGRSTRDSSCPPPPIRQRILWNWMPAPGHGMPRHPNFQTPCTLRLSIRPRNSDASHHGTLPHGVRYLGTATTGVIRAIREMDHKHLAEVCLGKSQDV